MKHLLKAITDSLSHNQSLQSQSHSNYNKNQQMYYKELTKKYKMIKENELNGETRFSQQQNKSQATYLHYNLQVVLDYKKNKRLI